MSGQLKKAQQQLAERERELREKVSDYEVQAQHIAAIQADLEKSRKVNPIDSNHHFANLTLCALSVCPKDLAAVTSLYEESRNLSQSQTLTLQRKEGDLSCLTIELEAKNATILKLQEQIARWLLESSLVCFTLQLLSVSSSSWTMRTPNLLIVRNS